MVCLLCAGGCESKEEGPDRDPDRGTDSGGLLDLPRLTERESEDGLYRYRMEDGMVVITQYRGEKSALTIPQFLDEEKVMDLDDHAIPESVEVLSLPVTVTEIGEEAFASCPGLKYLLVAEETSLPDSMPEGCRIFYSGTAYGELWLASLAMDPEGVLYGVLNDFSTAILLSVPEGLASYEIPELQGASAGLRPEDVADVTLCAVTSMDPKALEEADSLTSLTLNGNMSFPAEMYDRLASLEAFSYPEDSFTYDYILTLQAARQINEARSAADMDARIEPDLSVIRAARLRMEELGEAYSTNRPDSSEPETALTECGVSYNLMTSYTHHGANLDEMCGAMVSTLADTYANPQDVYQYDKLGLSAGYGPYSETEDYVMFAFLTSTTATACSYGGIYYELREDQLVPVSCQEGYNWLIMAGRLRGKPVAAPAEGFFESCASGGVRAFFLAEGCEAAVEEAIPDSFSVIRQGEDVGDGTASSLYVDPANGCVYVLTDRGCCVLWDIPAEITELELPETVGDYYLTYIHTNAVSGERALGRLGIPRYCGFDPAQYLHFNQYGIYVHDGNGFVLTEDYVGYYNSLYYALRMTHEMLTSINRYREDSAPAATAFALTRAAWELAYEQSELAGTIRPDGSEWYSVLEEESITGWGHGEIWFKTAVSLDEDIGLFDLLREIAAPNDNGQLYQYVGVGVGVDPEDNSLHFCFLAIESMD